MGGNGLPDMTVKQCDKVEINQDFLLSTSKMYNSQGEWGIIDEADEIP